MKEIVFATNNKHKLEEIRSITSNLLNILSLDDIGCTEEIQETALTLEGNAILKAKYVRDNYDKDCFADDTGLEVDCLGGRPGVHSARYAGEECIADNNIEKLLQELKNQQNRNARFRTVIALIINGQEHFFEGIVNGHIIEDRRGSQGFGYDPIFIPDGYSQTFAEMDLDLKNQISHRGRATAKLIEFLRIVQSAY